MILLNCFQVLRFKRLDCGLDNAPSVRVCADENAASSLAPRPSSQLQPIIMIDDSSSCTKSPHCNTLSLGSRIAPSLSSFAYNDRRLSLFRLRAWKVLFYETYIVSVHATTPYNRRFKWFAIFVGLSLWHSRRFRLLRCQPTQSSTNGHSFQFFIASLLTASLISLRGAVKNREELDEKQSCCRQANAANHGT
jgi:hypothetical protein